MCERERGPMLCEYKKKRDRKAKPRTEARDEIKSQAEYDFYSIRFIVKCVHQLINPPVQARMVGTGPKFTREKILKIAEFNETVQPKNKNSKGKKKEFASLNVP